MTLLTVLTCALGVFLVRRARRQETDVAALLCAIVAVHCFLLTILFLAKAYA